MGDPWVTDVDDAAFEREVVERSRQVPVVVDFWAQWCGPCRVLGPLLEGLARERAGAFVLAKVDIDRSPGLAARFEVRSVPAVTAFRDGRPTESFVGARPLPELRRWLDRVAPDEVERQALEAQALAATDPAGAEAALRRVLEARPRHERAAVTLARLALARGQEDEARDLLRRVAPGVEAREEVERLEAALALRALGRTCEEPAGDGAPPASPAEASYREGCRLAAEGRYEDALAALLEAARRDKKLGAGKAREAMVQVFYALGARDPLSDRYRSELARTIY
ncbi:MAG: tetratricopeptide repeat protein [Planctomycetes bacterium]|nr:tetratricopeptide repeat protein [Planctomycetota bacterium]